MYSPSIVVTKYRKKRQLVWTTVVKVISMMIFVVVVTVSCIC